MVIHLQKKTFFGWITQNLKTGSHGEVLTMPTNLGILRHWMRGKLELKPETLPAQQYFAED